MLEKRVQDLYVDYCIDQVIDWAVTPISIDRVIWDRQPEKYDYETECAEPTAGRIDFHMVEQKLCDITKLNEQSHMNMDQFNAAFLKNKGVWPKPKKREKGSLSPSPDKLKR